MSDSISKQKVLATLDFADKALDEERTVEKYKELLTECIKALPSVENKGEWIIREDNTSFVKQIPRRWVECSHCGWSFSYDRIHDDFCSKCGADMRGET